MSITAKSNLILRTLSNGSFRDKSGHENHPVNNTAEFRQTRYGLGGDFDIALNTRLTMSNYQLLGAGLLTFSALVYLFNWGGNGLGYIFEDKKFRVCIDSNGRVAVTSTGTALKFTGVGTIQLGNWYRIVITRDLAASTNYYVNNVLIVNRDTGTPTLGTGGPYIGNGSGSDRNFGGYIIDVRAYNKLLDAAERYSLDQEYLELKQLIQSPRTSFSFPAPSSVKETNLVGCWNGTRTSDGKLADISGEAHHITLSGALDAKGVRGRAIAFNGSSDTSIALNVAEDIKSFKIVCRIDNNTKDVVDFDGGTHYLKVAAGTLSAEGFASPTIYVDGEAGTTITTGKWHVIEVRTATAFTVSALRLGYAGNSYFQGIIDELEIRIVERELPAVQEAYNLIASLPVFSMNLQFAPADGITKVPVGVTLESGDTKIDEDAEGKYIEAVSNSVISVKGVDLNYLESNGFIKNILGDLDFDKDYPINESQRATFANNTLRVPINTAEKLRSLAIITNKRTFDLTVFVPSQIGWSHYFRAQPDYVTIATGASIWHDISGNGFDFIQAVTTKQALFNSNVHNGNYGLAFDGSDDFMAGSGYGTFSSPATRTYVFVFSRTSTSDKEALFGHHISFDSVGSFYLEYTTDRPRYMEKSTNYAYWKGNVAGGVGTKFRDGNPHVVVLEIIYNDMANCKLWVDGTLIGISTTSANTYTAWNTFDIGRAKNEYGNFIVSEFGVLGDEMLSSNRIKYQNWAINKYGIVV